MCYTTVTLEQVFGPVAHSDHLVKAILYVYYNNMITLYFFLTGQAANTA